MKKLALSCILLAIAAVPAFAITRGCTSAMVSLGLCRTTNDAVSCVAMSTVDPDAGGPRLAPTALALEAWASLDNWQATAACEASMVPTGICTAPQVGALVSVSKTQFLDWRMRLYVLDRIAQYQEKLRAAAKAAEAAAEPVPDVGN